MIDDQWLQLRSTIEDLVSDEVSDAVASAEAAERERAERDTQEGIIEALRDLRSNHDDGSEGARAMDEAIDAAERWTA